MNRYVRLFAVCLLGVLVSGCYLEGDIESLRPKKRYTVTFDANEGIGEVPAAQTVKTGSDITLPHQGGLSYDDYGFGGWNTEADGEGTTYPAGSAYTVTENVTLYAVWLPAGTEFTVTFDANEGIGEVPPVQTVDAGSVITVPNQGGLSRGTDIFGGWNTEADGEGTNYNAGDSYTPSGDVTLYARWIPAGTLFTVSFESNGGSAVSDQSVSAGDAAIQPADPARGGYYLDGWYLDSELNTKYDFGVPVTHHITLYAKWNALTEGVRLVTFESNGGSRVDNQVILLNNTARRPDNPTRSGYTFENWYSDEGLTAVYDFAAPVTDVLILYAKWIPNEALIAIEFEQISDQAPVIDGGAISRSGASTTITFTLANPDSYSSYEWVLDGVGIYAGTFITGSAASFEVDAGDERYNSLGGHTVYLQVVKEGVSYNTTIQFEVTE